MTRVLRKAVIAATEIQSDHPNRGRSKSIPREDAYLVGLQLRDYPRREYWEDGKAARRYAICMPAKRLISNAILSFSSTSLFTP